MQINSNNKQHSTLANAELETLDVPEYESSNNRKAYNQQLLRTDQVRLLQRQAITELVISLLTSTVVSVVLWDLAPAPLLIGWATAIVLCVGSRSLFISGKQTEKTQDDFNVWGKKYVVAIVLSGCCWGSLGVFSALFGELIHQVFALFVLSGICLTAYISFQSSTKTTAAFILPALLPMTACLLYQGLVTQFTHDWSVALTQENIFQLALGALTLIFAMVMQLSSRTMQTILVRSLKLGSHNTELIKNLVVTKEAANNARRH